MKLVLILLSLAASLFVMSGFATIAAVFQKAGSPSADAIGLTGIGIGCALFVAASICIWRAA